MKNFVIGLVVGLALVGVAFAAEQAYTVTFLDGVNVTPQTCADAKGKAALVADINEAGELTSDFEAACLVPVK